MRIGRGWFAQINSPDDATWDDIASFVARIGPPALAAFQAGKIGRPKADIGLFVVTGFASASLVVPNAVIDPLSQWGFNLQVSAYLAAGD